jgi:hypothetical protein
MSDPERSIQELEQEFPPASGAAFAQARKQVLASGQSVLQSEEGSLYEVFPDGRKQFIKQVEAPVRVTPGSKIKLW